MRGALDVLRKDPYLGEELHRELIGRRRVPVGRFRIVYRVRNSMVEVVAIGPRATIYVDLERATRSEPSDAQGSR